MFAPEGPRKGMTVFNPLLSRVAVGSRSRLVAVPTFFCHDKHHPVRSSGAYQFFEKSLHWSTTRTINMNYKVFAADAARSMKRNQDLDISREW